jgi:trafficking protein particle complex subunit 9
MLRVMEPLNPTSPTLSSDIQTFITDFSTRLLLSISDMANTIQALPTVRSPTDSTFFMSASMLTEPEELRRPASAGPESLRRTISTPSGKVSNRNSVISSQNASAESLVEKRGTSKGRGRVLKVLGDLNLLVGTLPGAVTSYTQSVEILRLTTDYLWHASALEGVGMALVLMSYLKVDYNVSH